MENYESGLSLNEVVFGFFRRRSWNSNDHLVIVGHNEADGSFFVFDRRQMRTRLQECFRKYAQPADQAKIVMGAHSQHFDENPKWKFEYIGSYGVMGRDDRINSFWHVVTLKAKQLEPIRELGQLSLCVDDDVVLKKQVGTKHFEHIKDIIKFEFLVNDTLQTSEEVLPAARKSKVA